MNETVVQPAPASTLVIFGASGDLTKRLLMPALYNLAGGELLDENFEVLGVARSESTTEDFRNSQSAFMNIFVNKGAADGSYLNDKAWSWLEQRLHYMSGKYDDPATYAQIARRIGTGNAVFFLAVPSENFGLIAEGLKQAGLMDQSATTSRRVIIEKPFGRDLATAISLNHQLLGMFEEQQIYRIDHFLGKEMVQNIMALRFTNSVFEPLWNSEHIESIQITAAEVVGVERRGSFYESTGALRDMIPNHLFQLMALIGMEPPASLEADDIRAEKARLIEAIRPLDESDINASVVRGQYGVGHIAEVPMLAYTEEPNVAPDSTTETYIALKLLVDNPRWQSNSGQTPFYLRTGKHLAVRRTEIVINFKPTHNALARLGATANTLLLRLHPDEGIALNINAKQPGQGFNPTGVTMDFNYKNTFYRKPNTGYESLLYDALVGNPTLYNRADNIEAGWRKVQPILNAVAAGKANLYPYASGSEGPEEAAALLARNNHHWRPLS